VTLIVRILILYISVQKQKYKEFKKSKVERAFFSLSIFSILKRNSIQESKIAVVTGMHCFSPPKNQNDCESKNVKIIVA